MTVQKIFAAAPFAAAFVLLFGATFAVADDLVLVQDGKPTAVIIVADNVVPTAPNNSDGAETVGKSKATSSGDAGATKKTKGASTTQPALTKKMKGAASADGASVSKAKGGDAATAPIDRSPIAIGQAATVLVDHLFQMSGGKLEIRKESELGAVTVQDGHVTPEAGKLPPEIKTFIFVGDSALAKQAGFSSEGLEASGIIVKTSGNALGLIGSTVPGDPQTSTYAVIQCLENLGCRYLWPGEDGKVIPKRPTVTVATVDYKFAPLIKQRGIRFVGMSERPASGLQKIGLELIDYQTGFKAANETTSPISWALWHHLGGNVGIQGGAAGGGLRGGWAEWGATHPEWFALQADGTRDQSKAAERFRLCVSNQGLVDHVADDIIERVKENPSLTCVSLCPNDGGASSFCQCDECKKLDAQDGPKVQMLIVNHVGSLAGKTVEMPALTDRFVHYWNAIAERVEKVYPNEQFLCEAYSYYSTPPVHEKLNPNIIIRYVPATTDGWDGWKAAGTKSLYWRPNILLTGRKDGELHVRTDELAKEMSFFADAGMLVTDFDSIIHNWSVQGLNYYAAAELDWNPKLTGKEILSDYSHTGFGAGGNSMQLFFERVQEICNTQTAAGVPPKEGRSFSPEQIAELRGFMGDAEKAAAGDDASLKRLAFIRIGLNYTELFSTLSRMSQAADGKTGTELAQMQAKARPLLALNSLVMRDMVRNHNLALNTPYLVWLTNEFANWDAIGARGYRAPANVLALGNDPAHSLTGRETSIDEMFTSFGTSRDAELLKHSDAAPAPAHKQGVDADENGKAIAAPAK